MNIRELIESTNRVPGRDKASVFQKKFGSIYAFNKSINIFKGGKAIIINMMIKGSTDMIKIGGQRKPVAYHKVSLALNVGEDGKKEYEPDELVSIIRINHKEYENEEEWPKWAILKEVLDKPDAFFDNATVFRMVNSKNYVVVTNNIPEDSEVQVWCSCSDYYWTFQYYNMQTRNNDGSCLNLYGSAHYPKSYNPLSKKGKESKAPLRNPGRNPGMCKHLMLLVAMLMEDDLISDPKNGLKKYYKANYGSFIKSNEKERVGQGIFASMQKRYEKDHRALNEQRNSSHYMAGNKIERKFNPVTGTHSIKAKNGFDPINQTFKRKRGR